MKNLILRFLRREDRIGSIVQIMLLRSVAVLVNVCTSLLTAAFLGPAGRGEQAALAVGPQFLAALSTLGLNAALIYNIKADPDHERDYFGATLLLALAAGSIAAGTGWLLEPVWLAKYDARTIATARLFLLVTPITSVSWALNAMLEVKGRFVVASRATYSAGFVTLVLLLALAKPGWLTPKSAAAAYLFPSIPILLFFALYVGRLVGPKLTLRPAVSCRLLDYGLRFYGVDVLSTFASYMDQILIVSFLTPRVVGIYVIAFSFSRVLNVIQTAVSTVLFPTVAAGHRSETIEMVALAVRITSAANVAGAIVLGLLGPYLLALFYGPRFAGAAVPFQILLSETVVSNAARILCQSYSGTGHPGVVTAIEGIGVSVSVTAMLMLIPLYGATGAAVAVLLASSLRLASALAALPIILKVRVPRLVLRRTDIAWIAGRW